MANELVAAAAAEAAATAADPVVADSPAAAPAATSPKSASKAAAAEAAPEVSTPAPASEAETFKSLAAKLGYDLEDGRVTTKERAAFRVGIKEARANFEREMAEAKAAWESEKGSHAEKMAKVDAVLSAYDRGDYEGLAKALGRKDWDDLQSDVIARLADPNYKRLQELERREKEREERDRKQREDYENMTKQQQKVAAISAYKSDLSSRMKASQDPLVREMHDDPGFIEAVFNIQQEHWDGSATITPERAIKLAVKGAKQALRDELEQLHKRLSKAFTPQAVENTPDEPESPLEDSTKRPKPKTAPAPKAAASPKGKFKSTEEWLRHAEKVLAEAQLRERAAR